MAILEEHPVFNPAIKVSIQQQNEKKKTPSPQPQETTLNLSLLEKPDGAAKEDKGVLVIIHYKLEVYHRFLVLIFIFLVCVGWQCCFIKLWLWERQVDYLTDWAGFKGSVFVLSDYVYGYFCRIVTSKTIIFIFFFLIVGLVTLSIFTPSFYSVFTANFKLFRLFSDDQSFTRILKLLGYQRRQTRYCNLFPARFFCGMSRNICVTAVPVFLQNISENTALLVKYVWGKGFLGYQRKVE